MELMILSKKQKQNQKQIMAKESRLGVPTGERGGSGMDGHFEVFGVFFLSFLGPHLQRMEVPRQGV